MTAIQEHWKLRVIRATRGNQTMMGAVVIAILGRQPLNPPKFGLRAHIDKHGVITVPFWTRGGAFHPKFPAFNVQQFVTELNRLADATKLDTAERLALFDEARKWIWKDERAEKVPLT